MSILPSACGMWAHYSPYPMINKSKPKKPTAHRWFMLHFHDIGRSDGQDNGKGADWLSLGGFLFAFPLLPQSDDDANFFPLLLVFLWRKIMQGRRRRRSHDRPLNSWRSSQSRRRTDGGSSLFAADFFICSKVSLTVDLWVCSSRKPDAVTGVEALPLQMYRFFSSEHLSLIYLIDRKTLFSSAQCLLH